MIVKHYTNEPDLWQELNLDKHNCCLWNLENLDPTTVVDYLKSLPTWNTASRIFCYDREGYVVYAKLFELKSNIYGWDSVINIDHERFCTWFGFAEPLLPMSVHRGTLEKLTNPLEHSPTYLFDCLLGRIRPHREFIYNKIYQNNLEHKFLLSYRGNSTKWLAGDDDLDSPESLTNHGLDPNDCISDVYDKSIVWGNYDHQITVLSTILPWKLYNDSWFSIVAETKTDIAFVTEKTLKALLGGRMFVMFCGAGILDGLKKHGFQTFSNVIDESYDSVADDQRRWQMAWDQVAWLCNQNPAEIYQACLPAVQHNQRLIRSWHPENTTWMQLKQQIQNLVPLP